MTQLNTVSTFTSSFFALSRTVRWVLYICLTVFVFLLTPSGDSHAVTCGDAECYVSATPPTNSTWEELPPPPMNSDGTVGKHRFVYTTIVCRSWFSGFFAQTVSSSYPLTPASCGAVPHAMICPPLADRSANGWTQVWRLLPEGGQVLQYSLCLYPTDAYAPVERKQGSGKIYVGGSAEFYQTMSSVSASAYGRTGTLTDRTGYVSRGVNLNNADAYTGAWSPQFTARTGKKPNGDPLYGYYRLIWDLDYKVCEKWGYPAWLKKPVRYDCSRGGTDRAVQSYTYACNLSPALRSGIVSGAVFRPSQCEQAWSCEVPDPIRFNQYADHMSTMRNGDPLTVEFPSLTVLTPDSDVVRQVRNEELRVSVVDGSTPWNKDARDANDRQQYFASSWSWGSWTKQRTGELRFYWASDDNRPFSIKADYRFTADFYVKAQDSLNGGTYSRFAVDTVECGHKTSSAITVLRSTSSSD